MAALFEEKKNPQEFMRTLKTNLVPEEVYVFTPKGKVINLPPGATALDFAFKIHTEVGLHATGARVNGSPAPLKTVLKTGDIIEILTSPDKAPTRGLLAAAATAGARQEIRRSLHLKSQATSGAMGRRLWDREVRRYAVPAALRRDRDLAPRLAAVLGARASSLEEFFRQVGLGRVVVDAKLIESVFGPVPLRRPGLISKAASLLAPHSGQGVLIRDLDGQMIKLAKCCGPIKGEAVVGYMTSGRGLTVHSLRCPRVTKEGLDPGRLVEVGWDDAFAGEFKARLLVKTQDTPGVLAKVAAAVADLEGDISKAEAAMAVGARAHIILDLRIRDIRQLEAIARRISGQKEVLSVERV
jgi:GTP pyrophosphokinase